MSQCKLPLLFSSLLAGIAATGVLFMTGCGLGEPATGVSEPTGAGTPLTGVIHGGLNPVIGATVTLYFTAGTGSGSTSAAYGAGATAVASTTTVAPNGTFTLGNPSGACPSGGYAYVGVYGGNTGGNTTNANSLLMVPVGACSTNYSSSSPYAYTGGSSLFINEITTALSAYALGNFMTLSHSGMTGVPPTCGTGVNCQINIGAPLNNTATASTSTPSAAGLTHAFANALALMNISTGQPNGWTNGGTSNSTGGVIPDAEIFALGNILQACVNSSGVNGTNTATSNDGSLCGKLFSFTTPPSSTTPTNTLQAMLNLAKNPIPGGQANQTTNTWNTNCTSSGNISTTSACLFALASGNSGAYPNALTNTPPDWVLAVVYPSGYGAQTTGCSSTCPGLSYPFYVALDYADNVYVLNYNAYNSSNGATTYTNIINIANSGQPLWASPQDTTDLTIPTIGTDTSNHVFGAVAGAGKVIVYNAASGAVVQTVTSGVNASDSLVIADPSSNIYSASGTTAGINLRKLTYSGSSYTASTITSSSGTLGPYLQMAWDPSVDLYLLGSTPVASILPNTGNYSANTYGTTYTFNTGSISGTTGSNPPGVWGIASTSTGNAFVLTSAGVTTITKTGSGATTAIAAGSATSLPELSGDSSTASFRGSFVDGQNNLFTPDGDNGAGVSGIAEYNTTSGYLGTYKGCYVVTYSSPCGTTAGNSPIYSPRGAAIDSSGDIWVVSGSGANLTELIGAAAPTWPGLSMAKFGLPQ